MKPKFVRCEYCKVEIPSETCSLAAYTTTINGEKYTFCCIRCAERYEQKRTAKLIRTRSLKHTTHRISG
jgi:YHS domain-containing protein